MIGTLLWVAGRRITPLFHLSTIALFLLVISAFEDLPGYALIGICVLYVMIVVLITLRLLIEHRNTRRAYEEISFEFSTWGPGIESFPRGAAPFTSPALPGVALYGKGELRGTTVESFVLEGLSLPSVAGVVIREIKVPADRTSVVMLHIERALPTLAIVPQGEEYEGSQPHREQTLGTREFQRMWRVFCNDDAFAAALITPELEHVLIEVAAIGQSIAIAGDRIYTWAHTTPFNAVSMLTDASVLSFVSATIPPRAWQMFNETALRERAYHQQFSRQGERSAGEQMEALSALQDGTTPAGPPPNGATGYTHAALIGSFIMPPVALLLGFMGLLAARGQSSGRKALARLGMLLPFAIIVAWLGFVVYTTFGAGNEAESADPAQSEPEISLNISELLPGDPQGNPSRSSHIDVPEGWTIGGATPEPPSDSISD